MELRCGTEALQIVMHLLTLYAEAEGVAAGGAHSISCSAGVRACVWPLYTLQDQVGATDQHSCRLVVMYLGLLVMKRGRRNITWDHIAITYAV